MLYGQVYRGNAIKMFLAQGHVQTVLFSFLKVKSGISQKSIWSVYKIHLNISTTCCVCKLQHVRCSWLCWLLWPGSTATCPVFLFMLTSLAGVDCIMPSDPSFFLSRHLCPGRGDELERSVGHHDGVENWLRWRADVLEVEVLDELWTDIGVSTDWQLIGR